MRFLLLAATCALLSPAAQATGLDDYLVAQFAARQGDMPVAAAHMLAASQADPSDLDLRKDAFALALLAGRPEAADLAAQLPDNFVANLLVADDKATAGDWEGAELIYAELPADDLPGLLKPVLLAWSQQAQGYTDKAMATLQPALTNGHLGPVYQLQAALLADAAHRDGLAGRIYADLAKIQAVEPNLRLGEILANWQARNGDLAAARATINGMVAAQPDLALARSSLLASLSKPEVPDARHGIAEALVELAAELKSQKHGEDAAAMLCQLALRVAPAYTPARLMQADIATAAKRHDDAIAVLQAIPANDPIAPLVRLRLANQFAEAGQTAAAVRLLTALAADHPDQPAPLALLGDVQSDNQHYSEALAAYDQAVALVPTPQRDDWGLFYARAATLERLHDWDRAEADITHALELSPDQPAALNFLGYFWADRGKNLPEARAMIEKAMQARPNDGAIIDSMGWVLLRQGDTRAALHMLEKAAEMEPEDPSISGHLGDAYWNLGRHLEATDQWRRALILHPDPDDLDRIQSRLRSATSH